MHWFLNRNLSSALLFELKSHELDKQKPKPSPQLLLDVNKYLEIVGQYNPLEKVYVKMSKNSDDFLSFVVIFTLQHLSRLAFGKNLMKYNKSTGVHGAAIAKQRKILLDLISSSRYIDGHVFFLGLITLLRQFYENNYMMEFVRVLGSCLLEMMEYNLR